MFAGDNEDALVGPDDGNGRLGSRIIHRVVEDAERADGEVTVTRHEEAMVSGTEFGNNATPAHQSEILQIAVWTHGYVVEEVGSDFPVPEYDTYDEADVEGNHNISVQHDIIEAPLNDKLRCLQ